MVWAVCCTLICVLAHMFLNTSGKPVQVLCGCERPWARLGWVKCVFCSHWWPSTSSGSSCCVLWPFEPILGHQSAVVWIINTFFSIYGLGKWSWKPFAISCEEPGVASAHSVGVSCSQEQRWFGVWSISLMRGGCRSWAWLLWRREGWEGIPSTLTNISKVGVERRIPDSLWCSCRTGSCCC